MNKSIKRNPENYHDETFLTRHDVANKFKISYRTVIRWEETGVLSPVRFGRNVRHLQSDVINVIYAQ
jgi:predicted site-specific integrase-resolvase